MLCFKVAVAWEVNRHVQMCNFVDPQKQKQTCTVWRRFSSQCRTKGRKGEARLDRHLDREGRGGIGASKVEHAKPLALFPYSVASPDIYPKDQIPPTWL